MFWASLGQWSVMSEHVSSHWTKNSHSNQLEVSPNARHACSIKLKTCPLCPPLVCRTHLCTSVTYARHVRQENAIGYCTPGLKPSNGTMPRAFLYLARTQPSGHASHSSSGEESHILARARIMWIRCSPGKQGEDGLDEYVVRWMTEWPQWNIISQSNGVWLRRGWVCMGSSYWRSKMDAHELNIQGSKNLHKQNDGRSSEACLSPLTIGAALETGPSDRSPL